MKFFKNGSRLSFWRSVWRRWTVFESCSREIGLGGCGSKLERVQSKNAVLSISHRVRKGTFRDAFLIKINRFPSGFGPRVESKKRAKKFLDKSGFLPAWEWSIVVGPSKKVVGFEKLVNESTLGFLIRPLWSSVGLSYRFGVFVQEKASLRPKVAFKEFRKTVWLQGTRSSCQICFWWPRKIEMGEKRKKSRFLGLKLKRPDLAPNIVVCYL